MSAIGQNTKSIRKRDLPNSRIPAIGIKSTKFHHQAVAGETIIDITNLNVPTEMVNPSPTELIAARLKDFSDNLILMSSARAGNLLMEGLSYEVVTNTTIKLKFEAYENEIFTGVFQNNAINGTLIGDVRTPSASGSLSEGTTEFNLGEAILITDVSSQWPMQVFRGPLGRPMMRNINNGPYTGNDSIGNYQMIDRGDGYCQIIKFNVSANTGGEVVIWASHGALGERPNLSTLQRVDKIHGIVDKMREDMYDVTGYGDEDPTRYDEGVPTQADIKAFGDKVFALEQILDVSIPQPPKQYDISSYLAGDLPWNSSSAVAIPYMTFDGTWRLRFNIRGTTSGTSGAWSLTIGGVVFRAGTNQAVTGYQLTSLSYYTGLCRAESTNSISISTSTAASSWCFSGDIELASKPTWASDYQPTKKIKDLI